MLKGNPAQPGENENLTQAAGNGNAARRAGKSFAIHTLGCKVNTYESDRMAQAMRAAGFEERAFDESADVYIVNTCTVTNIADRKSRQMLRRVRRLNPDATIAAAGCYVDDAARTGKLAELISGHVIDLAIPNKDKDRAVSLICEKLSEGSGDFSGGEPFGGVYDCGASGGAPDGDKCFTHGDTAGIGQTKQTASGAGFLTELDGHSRAFIKVQDGCTMYCSYCVIPYVRGEIRIRPTSEVLDEIRSLASQGITETVITGINLSSLGLKLIDILKGIEEIDGIRRVRLGSLEPMLIKPAFVAELKKITKLCPHFHLSLQSGSDTVLKRMNRHYTAWDYAACCELLKSAYGHPAITTDIIVGFPGETEEEFAETCAFAERIGFYEAHVFKYSRRSGTAADRMDGQLTDAVKSRRSDVLMSVTDRLSSVFRSYYIGRKVSFLSEEMIEIDGESYETGYTPEYIKCIKSSRNLHQNEIISGKAIQIVRENDVDLGLLLV